MIWWLRISVLFNLGLLVGAGYVWYRPTPSSAAAQTNPVPSARTAAASDQAEVETAPSPTIITVTNAFHWDALESTNYLEFAANLRAVHCPEATVRDLILADACRRHESLAEEDADLSLPFWLAGRARTAANRAVAIRRNTGQAGLLAEVQNALGIEFHPEEEELNRPAFQALARVIVGPVSDAEFDATKRWLFGIQHRRELFDHARDGILLRADHAEWRRQVHERFAPLQQALNPAAFEEFQARTAFLEEIVDNETLHLSLLELEPQELRQLSLLKVREMGWLDDLLHLDEYQSPETAEARQLALVAAAEGCLTPAHYAELVRIQDEDYRDLVDLALDHELPRRVAAQVLELQQTATAEYQRLRAQSDDPAAVTTAAELQVATAAAVARLLGPDAFKRYSEHDGKWMNHLGTP